MVTGPNGKIREHYYKQNGIIKYNDKLVTSNWFMEQDIDADGNRVLKPLGSKRSVSPGDGSSRELNWTNHWIHLHKFSDEFFVLPKPCRHL